VSLLDVAKLPPGTVLMDKYRVVETLGVGGMGAVVACEHLSLDSKVAVKFLLPQLTGNDHVVKRFMNEAKAATKIQSDHVARVIDVGHMRGEGLPDEGVPYMVMEYLHGHDLGQHVRSGRRFSVPEAVDYVVQAAEALAKAHRVGIIHRDVKPANLFLAEREQGPIVKVLDFGISKILDEEPQEMGLTKTTTVLGSGLYMSPEQMRSAKMVDTRTDIYSLGVCMYELLTGTQPYTAETFSELCVKVNIDPPTPLRKWRPDISPELAAVLEKAYARDPADRFQTVQELVAALAPFAAPPSLSTIQHVQGITSYADRSSRMPALAQTAGGAMTAEPGASPGRPLGMAITMAIAALLLATGLGIFVIQTQRDDGQAAAAPSETATAASSAPDERRDEDSGEAEVAATASASASASASATASASARPKGGKAPPGPAPEPRVELCNRLNPETGMMELVPCH
jgi:serine/threonine-protein kinase